MAAVVCIQRILNDENEDYSKTFTRSTRHFVRVEPGVLPLQQAVFGLLAQRRTFVPLNFALSGATDDTRRFVDIITGQLVQAVATGEADAHKAVVDARAVERAAPVESLDVRAYHRLCISNFIPAAPEAGMLVVQWFDDEAFQSRVRAFHEEHGIDTDIVYVDSEEEEEDAVEEYDEEESEEEEEEEDEM